MRKALFEKFTRGPTVFQVLSHFILYTLSKLSIFAMKRHRLYVTITVSSKNNCQKVSFVYSSRKYRKCRYCDSIYTRIIFKRNFIRCIMKLVVCCIYPECLVPRVSLYKTMDFLLNKYGVIFSELNVHKVKGQHFQIK